MEGGGLVGIKLNKDFIEELLIEISIKFKITAIAYRVTSKQIM